MTTEKREQAYKGTKFYEAEIDRVGLKDKLPFFNDVLTGNEKPEGYGDPVLVDVVLDSRVCDVYHTDMNGTKRIANSSGNRIYIHFKDATN